MQGVQGVQAVPPTFRSRRSCLHRPRSPGGVRRSVCGSGWNSPGCSSGRTSTAGARPTYYGPTYYGPTYYGPTYYGSAYCGSAYHGPTYDGPTYDGPTYYDRRGTTVHWDAAAARFTVHLDGLDSTGTGTGSAAQADGQIFSPHLSPQPPP